MMRLARSLAVIAIVCLLFAGAHGQGWKLVWEDEFNGRRNAPPDAKNWTAEVGGHGWGNKELEYYLAGPETAYLDGEGHLVIKADKRRLPPQFKCWYGPCEYVSARLTTKNKFSQLYGRIEARIKLPRGQGIWPAFWMLGADIDRVGWPTCGEIDIMENIGREPSTVHGTIHGPGYSGAKGIGAPYSLPGRRRFADDFHVFAIEWEPNAIRWYVDDVLYETRTPADLPPGARWVYDHPFFIILNVAIGGSWPGAPDESTQFPQTMLVDYVRVYKP
jgi:beta-glucanase (GH16 family)